MACFKWWQGGGNWEAGTPGVDLRRGSRDRAWGRRGGCSARIFFSGSPCSVETLEARQLLAATVGVPAAFVLGPSPSLAGPLPSTPALASSLPPSSGFSLAPLPLVSPGASCGTAPLGSGDRPSPPPVGGSAALDQGLPTSAGPGVSFGGGSGDGADGWMVFASTESDGKPEGGGADQPPADDIPPPNSDGVLDAKALLRGRQRAEEFRAAKKAFSQLPDPVRQLMHGVLSDKDQERRPLQDFLDLSAENQKIIVEYYRITGATAYRENANAVRQLNQHRIDYLTGKRSDPPGPMSNFPKPKVP